MSHYNIRMKIESREASFESQPKLDRSLLVHEFTMDGLGYQLDRLLNFVMKTWTRASTGSARECSKKNQWIEIAICVHHVTHSAHARMASRLNVYYLIVGASENEIISELKYRGRNK